ncbi:hypothetical protein BJV74DRAFT_303985 [Russula compacta]|nr:hypothetical protein BJV74DRAFT_303985 [Russula compacta]
MKLLLYTFRCSEPFVIRFVQLVVASSPKGADQGWIKQAGHGSIISSLVTKLWSLEELIRTGLILALLLQRSTVGYSFITMISLSRCSGGRPRISATTLVNALQLPPPWDRWDRKRDLS